MTAVCDKLCDSNNCLIEEFMKCTITLNNLSVAILSSYLNLIKETLYNRIA